MTSFHVKFHFGKRKAANSRVHFYLTTNIQLWFHSIIAHTELFAVAAHSELQVEFIRRL